MKKIAGKFKYCLWSAQTLTLLLSMTGCRILDSFSEDTEIVASEPVRVTVDGSSISPQQWSGLSDNQRQEIEQRFIAIEQWISDADTWFIPFAAHYLPELNSSGQKRLLTVINSDPLIKILNQRDIAINLTADIWASAPDPLTLPLRESLIRTALKKSHPAVSPPWSDLKKEYLQAIFFNGVPTYISSFGVRIEKTPLLQSLLGERDQIEEQFEILRKPLRAGKTAFVPSDRTEAVQTALNQIGIWICQRVESNLGTDIFIDAIDEGPEKLYEKYLETNPGIFMSLETVPVEALPLPGQSITH